MEQAGSVPVAIVMARRHVARLEAESLLEASGGKIAVFLGDVTLEDQELA